MPGPGDADIENSENYWLVVLVAVIALISVFGIVLGIKDATPACASTAYVSTAGDY